MKSRWMGALCAVLILGAVLPGCGGEKDMPPVTDTVLGVQITPSSYKEELREAYGDRWIEYKSDGGNFDVLGTVGGNGLVVNYSDDGLVEMLTLIGNSGERFSVKKIGLGSTEEAVVKALKAPDQRAEQEDGSIELQYLYSDGSIRFLLMEDLVYWITVVY